MNLSGSPVDFILAFLYGVLASFTPCVYPLIPVSVGYIGATRAQSRWKGFKLSFIYVSGIALTYSALGMFAALGGRVFGEVSSLPLVHLAAGIVIFILGLSMLDLLRLPSFGIKRLPELKRKNYFTVFILGLSSGLLISPCVTPMLGAILSYLATRKNIFYGALLLLSFAYGLGFILILAGTSGYLLGNYPRAGKWMVWIKRLCAFVLIGAGIYFIFNGIRRM